MKERTVFLQFQVPAELEGVLCQVTTALGITEEKAFTAFMLYGLNRLKSGIPLKESVERSLADDDSSRKLTQARLKSVVLAAEKAISDSVTIHRALSSIISVDVPERTADAGSPTKS